MAQSRPGRTANWVLWPAHLGCEDRAVVVGRQGAPYGTFDTVTCRFDPTPLQCPRSPFSSTILSPWQSPSPHGEAYAMDAGGDPGAARTAS